MSRSITRRSFVQTAALAGVAGALAATSHGSLEKADQAWADEAPVTKIYTSTCHGCIQSCPCRVYTENDIVVKIEGNPYAPTSMGSMCMKGYNQIHTCYSPRRVLYPLKRTGARGAENAAWERISWEEAIDLAATKIAESIEKYGTYSFMCGVGGGGSYSGSQARAMPRALGSPTVIEPGCAQCYLPRVATTNYMGSSKNQSIGDSSATECFKGLSKFEQAKGIENETKGVVIWGAQPSVSQTAQSGRGMAELRARGCKTIVVDPNMSPDAVKATVWLRVRPGADAALLLSWYRYIFENDLYDAEFTKYFTNLPMIINPETKLPFYATDIFPDFQQTTPEDTPAFVCYDNMTQSLRPIEFGDPEVLKTQIDPEIFWSGEVNGVACKSAGQIYRDAAEPWTLEEAERVCWVPADVNEKAIRLYTNADGEIEPVEGGVPFGIANGVATEMQQNASQVVLGCVGLDMIMGYINKRGATITQVKTRGYAAGNLDDPQPRPTFSDSNTASLGVGYVVGAGDAANEARIAAFEDQSTLYAMNQVVLDRLGTKNHKGLNHWWHSHIPSVLEAIKTGVPYKPRVWYEMSGNKLAMLGTASAWYDAFPELDFVICQYPNMTSFHMETCDLMLPLEEWLESPNAAKDQLNYSFGMFPVIHLGETVSNAVPPYQVTYAASKKLNDRLDAGAEILFGYVGSQVGAGPAQPSSCTAATDEELQTSVNASYYHERDLSRITVRFPFCKVDGAERDDDVFLQQLADQYSKGLGGKAGDMTYEELRENYDEYREEMDELISEDKGWVVFPSKDYWLYDQHLNMAVDGLPVGFPTESRKCEVYCTAMIKLANTGWPLVYPRPQEPCDPTIGEEIKAVQPDYEYVGMYSPICQHVEPHESALEGDPGYDPEYPLTITSGRVYYFHHSTMRHAPFAREIYPVPDVRINPKTAEKYGIKHMDWVEITSRRGSIRGRAYLHAGMHENVLWMERFYNPECYDSSQPKITGGWRECNINVLTKATAPFNEVFGSYTNRGFGVNIKKSEKPEGVWVEPKEFEPFMPNNGVGWFGFDAATNGIGNAIDLPQSPRVTFSAELSLPE